LVRLAEENLKSHQRIYDQIQLRTQPRCRQRMRRPMDQADAPTGAGPQNNLITEQTNLADSETNYSQRRWPSMPDQLERPAPFMALMPVDLQRSAYADAGQQPGAALGRSPTSPLPRSSTTLPSRPSTHASIAELGRTADNNDLDGHERS
jgi:adhesin transport system outer membrane protein